MLSLIRASLSQRHHSTNHSRDTSMCKGMLLSNVCGGVSTVQKQRLDRLHNSSSTKSRPLLIFIITDAY